MDLTPTDFLSGLGGLANLPHPYDDQQQVIQNQQQNQGNAQALQLGAAKLAGLAQQQQQAQQYQSDVAAALKNPSASNFAALYAKYPDQHEALKQAWDAQDAPTKQGNLTQLGNIFSYLSNGKSDLAVKSLQTRIDAEKAAGLDTSDDEQMLGLMTSGKPEDLTAAKGVAGMHLAAAMGTDKYGDMLKTLGLDQGGDKGFTLSEGQVRFDGSGKVVASGPAKSREPHYYTLKDANGVEHEFVDYGEGPQPTGGGGQASSGGAPSGGGGAPLSVRLNNPGAIRFSPTNQWQGQVGNEGGFVQFDTPANGDRAHRLLIANQIKGGFDTPLAWAQHYAPATDGNDPQAYAARVAAGLGIGINDKIPLSAVPKMAAISAQVEAGGTPAPGRTGLTAPAPGGPRQLDGTPFATEAGGNSLVPDNLTGDQAQAYLQQKNPGLANRIQGIMAGKIPYPNATRKDTQPILNTISQIDPSFDATKWKARNETSAQYAAGGAAGKVLTSGATAVSHLYDLALAAQKLPDHYFGWQNSWDAKTAPVGSDTGKTIIQFNRSRTLYAPEVSKYLAGNGQAPEGETKKHYESFDPGLGRTGNLNNLVTDTKFITDKFDAQGAAYQQTMGKPLVMDGDGKTGGPVTAKLAAMRWWSDNPSKPVPVVVMTPQQARALPKGTIVATPDGRVAPVR